MRRLRILALAALVALGAVACSGDDSGQDDTGVTVPSTVGTEPDPGAEPDDQPDGADTDSSGGGIIGDEPGSEGGFGSDGTDGEGASTEDDPGADGAGAGDIDGGPAGSSGG